jgi:hypothetical protein
MRLLWTAPLLACALAHATSAGAQTIPLTISGRTATASIELPGGYAVDLSIRFERVVGLNADALAVSVRVVTPLDLGLRSRLPNATLAAGLPLVIRIEPTLTSALSLEGVVTISLYTHNLDLDLRAPPGLFSASSGGTFREITRAVSMGSYRVDGSGGGFSEFLIARDARSIDVVIMEKFEQLNDVLHEHSSRIPDGIFQALLLQLVDAQALFAAGLTQPAIDVVTAFTSLVEAQSGLSIPDVWRANDSRPNVAGLLRAGADTLKFSLTLKANQTP